MHEFLFGHLDYLISPFLGHEARQIQSQWRFAVGFGHAFPGDCLFLLDSVFFILFFLQAFLVTFFAGLFPVRFIVVFLLYFFIDFSCLQKSVMNQLTDLGLDQFFRFQGKVFTHAFAQRFDHVFTGETSGQMNFPKDDFFPLLIRKLFQETRYRQSENTFSYV